MASVVVVLALLVAGTVVGEDHDFPFGPFRMFSTSGRVDGVVHTTGLVRTVDGRELPLRSDDLGLRQAELEGQLGKLARDPAEVVTDLARRADDLGVRLDRLRIVRRTQRLRDRVPSGAPTTRVLAVWERTGEAP